MLKEYISDDVIFNKPNLTNIIMSYVYYMYTSREYVGVKGHVYTGITKVTIFS